MEVKNRKLPQKPCISTRVEHRRNKQNKYNLTINKTITTNKYMNKTLFDSKVL